VNIVAGSPLSYWQGVHGKFPMRYMGGLLGGSWITAMLSDIGCGLFDGAWLVQNFENQDPANTFWSKPYNLYSKIDTEPPRYLQFEKWWGGHVILNDNEIQFIVDELFVGNRLSAGGIETSDGTSVDLRNIRSPIVVICSKGDNITPPQQALGWITDLYESVDEIRSYGQTIVYSVHDTAGHLGIFVSGSVAKKEHAEFASNIDFIDILPPGLYEAIFEPKSASTLESELVTGDWVMRCEPRTLDDIRALGGNDVSDDRRFATAAHVSEINLALYQQFWRPVIRSATNPVWADWLRELHPLRLQFKVFSDRNPVVAAIAPIADVVSKRRHRPKANNPFLAIQEMVSTAIEAGLNFSRDINATISEATFLSLYGSPALQAAVGIDPASKQSVRTVAKTALHRELLQKRISELKSRVAIGGLREAVIRALLYMAMAPGRAFDERGFQLVRRIRQENRGIPLAEFKAMIREQFNILLIDEVAALRALPALLPASADARKKALALISRIMGATGEKTLEGQRRLREIVRLFGAGHARHHPRPTGNGSVVTALRG
jgi:uncharacterized protein DUF3141